MKVSECCGATFYEPGYPDNDICSDCREHAEPMEEDDPPYEKPNLIQQRISRDDYKHGWRKEGKNEQKLRQRWGIYKV